MSNTIYRVFDKKGKYQQSYSSKLKDSYVWAIDCAEATKGSVHQALINDKGFTESSSVVYPGSSNAN